MANRKYDGSFNVKNLKGKQSAAAKAAFQDILEDPDMRVSAEFCAADGHFPKVAKILEEDDVLMEEV